uniref:Endonuclease n=1 Tax=Syphacia muris TaxID=451379 RepID=A0A0N5AY36_9BILA
MSRFGRLSGIAGAVVASFFGGIYAERKGALQNAKAASDALTMPMPTLTSPSAEASINVKQPTSRASQIMQYGYPGFENVRSFEDFVLSYDRRNRTPLWVIEHLTPSRLVYDPLVDRSKCAFMEDKSMHPYFRSANNDYLNSGYDRGHLAAAGNHRKTQNAINQTFLLSNIAPQVGKGFNRDKWNELEKRVRKIARRSENVYVCSGPLFLPHIENDGKMYVKYRVIGQNNVAVPTHFFKVLLIEFSPGKFDLEAYVLPNEKIPDSTPLKAFFMPLEAIERSAGFLIFEKLPKESLRYVNGQEANFL